MIEQPQHDVTLPAFFIARYPTTVAQFRAFVDDSGHRPSDPTACPAWPTIRSLGHLARRAGLLRMADRQTAGLAGDAGTVAGLSTAAASGA